MAITTITQPNAVSVPFEELDGSPREQVTDQGFQATRELLCTWANRLALAEELKGGVFVVEDGSGNQSIVRRLPHTYPEKPEAVARSVEIVPFDSVKGEGGSAAADARASYDFAQLTVTYAVPEQGEREDEDNEEVLVSESLTQTSEFLTLPERDLYWDNAQSEPVEKENRPGMLTHTVTWIYIRHKMLKLPSGVLSLVGTVNSAAVTSTSLGLTFSAGTLLYGSPNLSRDITTDGKKAWRVEFHFQYKPTGWNKFYKQGSSAPQSIYDGGGGTVKVYPSDNFTALLS